MYYPVFTIMRIRIKRDVLVEIIKTRLQETWDKQLYRGNELHVDNISVEGPAANLTDFDGDVFLNVPTNAYEVIS